MTFHDVPALSWPAAMLALLGAACGGAGDEGAQPGPAASATGGGSAELVTGTTSSATAPPAPRAPEPFDLGGDGEADALRRVEAMPAWTAVIERHRLLGRRGERGAVWGRLFEQADRRWLIDESEGDGSLGIRLDLPADYSVSAGQRLIVWGAWAIEEGWVWRADELRALPPAPAGDAQAAPGHRVAEIDEPPEDAVPVSAAGDPALVVFAVIERPRRVGAGWMVADGPGQTAAAILLLPGEREPYGGLDYLAPDERWPLEIGSLYVAPVRRLRQPRGETRQLLRATSAPVRVAAR